MKATAVSGSLGIEDITGPNIDKATFTTYNVIADRIGANQVSVRLVSTGSGNVRCVVIPLDANKNPDASDIIDGKAYGNTDSISNSSLISFTANEEKV